MDKRAIVLALVFIGYLAMPAFSLSYEMQRDYFVAIHFFQQGKEEKGEKLLSKLLQGHPNLFDVYIRFYELAVKHKQWDKALEWLNRADKIPVDSRLIIDSDLLSFQINQAVKAVQEKKIEAKKSAAKEREKKQKRQKAEERKMWRKMEAPYLLLENGELKVYRGKQDKIKRSSIVTIEYKGASASCAVATLRSFSITLSCQNLPKMPKKGKLLLKVKRLQKEKKQ